MINRNETRVGKDIAADLPIWWIIYQLESTSKVEKVEDGKLIRNHFLALWQTFYENLNATRITSAYF